MNYLRIYKQLIQKRKKQLPNQKYTETHHILPRSLNLLQSKNKNNLVILSAREHFIAHALLVKITQKSNNKENYYKMLHAFNQMKANKTKKRYINSHLYELFKHRYSEARSYYNTHVSNPSKGKIWIFNLELEQNRLINKEQQIPEGWLKGRIQNFISYKNKLKRKQENKNRFEENKQKKTNIAIEYFEVYKIKGYSGVVQKFNYKHSRVMLCKMFNRYLKEQYEQIKKLKNN